MKYYTMIGSRETPEDILMIMEKLAIKLFYDGWTVRSGGANGADSAAEAIMSESNPLAEIYIPWNGFNNHYRNKYNIVYSDLDLIDEAIKLCEIHHQYWKTIKKEAIKHLHRRNMHQVLGKDLKTPSKFCILYATPDDKLGEGHVKGGTGSANSLCLEQGVKVFNLYYQKEVDRIKKYLEE